MEDLDSRSRKGAGVLASEMFCRCSGENAKKQKNPYDTGLKQSRQANS